LEFDATDCISLPRVIATNTAFNWLIIYEGTGNDGWSCTFTLTTNEVPYWKTTTSFPIIATGSDLGPSGMKNVTLWYRYRATNTSSWEGWARWNDLFNPDTTPWAGISWEFTSPNGSGRYEFYSIATDNVSNTESTPGSADISVGVDTEAPISSVNTIEQYWTSLSSRTLTVDVTDAGSGVKNVTLYTRYSPDNITWDGWTSLGVDTTRPWSWFITLSNGTGYYEYYSIAYDNLTFVEAVPGTADTGCGYETTAPSSSMNDTTPYWKKTGTTLTAVASDDASEVHNVTLLYRFSNDNSSWGAWVAAGVDPAAPWSWDFPFPNGTGYYQFFSRAQDHAENTESPPGSADSIAGYENQAPFSQVDAISGYWKDTSPLLLTATTSDMGPSGVQSVTLFYQYRITNSSNWGSNISFGVDTTPWDFCSWSFTFPEGAGHYRFYSVAIDNATNVEAPSGGLGDATCGYNTGAPVSTINDIAPYWSSQTPVTISATAEDYGPSGLKNVTLYYFYSADNTTWHGPWFYAVDSDPWVTCSWDFSYPNQTGYYRFYSCAADNSSHIEEAPLLNDSECGYDTQPPICSITYNKTQESFKAYDKLRIIVTFSEMHSGMNESSILLMISTKGNGSLGNTSLVQIDATHWFYDWVIPTGSDEDGEFITTIYASDAVSNTLDPFPTTENSKDIDNTPPTISNLALDSLTANSVHLLWSTNENTTGHIEFGPSPSFGSWLHNMVFTKTHDYILSGLSPATTYYYRVISSDAAGNQNVSSAETFTTTQQTQKRTQSNTKQRNDPPSLPLLVGPPTGNATQTIVFRVRSTDANNDSLLYTFDWGDTIVESSALIPSGQSYTINHSWMKAGKYTIQVTASDSSTSVSSRFIIWIDAVAVTDIGYLTDENGDGTYDNFYNQETGSTSVIEKRNGVYLIDMNGDHEWEYEYNVTNGMLLSILRQTSGTQPTPLSLMLIFVVIIIVFLVLFSIVYIRRLYKKQ
jgi:Purple acid Phosphatase, N-terminal domain/PKD domain